MTVQPCYYSSHGMAEQGDLRSLDQVGAFRLAHREAGQNKPLYLDHPQFEGFEVRQTVRRGEDEVA
jgi:hypothetical protein